MVSDFRIQLYAQEIKTNKKAKLFTRCYQVNVTGYICFVFYSFSCFACFLYLFMTISIIFLCCCWCCWYLNLGPILPLIFWNQQHKDNTGRTSLICTIANLFLFFLACACLWGCYCVRSMRYVFDGYHRTSKEYNKCVDQNKETVKIEIWPWEIEIHN